jgi:hypothetical protein
VVLIHRSSINFNSNLKIFVAGSLFLFVCCSSRKNRRTDQAGQRPPHVPAPTPNNPRAYAAAALHACSLPTSPATAARFWPLRYNTRCSTRLRVLHSRSSSARAPSSPGLRPFLPSTSSRRPTPHAALCAPPPSCCSSPSPHARSRIRLSTCCASAPQ